MQAARASCYNRAMSAARTLLDIAQGLLAGYAAMKVKGQAEATLQPLGERWFPPEPGEKELLGADPAGHLDRMPPTNMYLRVAAALGQDLQRGRDDEQIAAGGEWFHRAMAFGYPVVYSLLTRRVPAARAGLGAVGGMALFATTHLTLVPAAGLQAPVREMGRSWWVWEAGSHLAYGVTTDLTLRAVRAITR